jgi:hypothetical protein
MAIAKRKVINSEPPDPNAKPWDQLPEETDKQFAAFLVYLNLGANRTVKKAIEEVGKRGKTNGQRSWDNYAASNRWLERASAYDIYIQQELKSRNEDFMVVGKKSMAEAYCLSAQMLADILRNPKDHQKIKDYAPAMIFAHQKGMTKATCELHKAMLGETNEVKVSAAGISKDLLEAIACGVTEKFGKA